ncbi:MAG TPA: PilT/PilU family type 4a pilus ATPase [Terriglobales bacterium]|nr:PilT/PilU family type 4a pilus ATPase [Terriglobales bacterium]
MAAPGNAPLSVVLEPSTSSGAMATDALLAAILRANDQVSDLIFSPGRLPQVEVHGQLIGIQGIGLRPFSADDTRRIASDLIGENKQAIGLLREQGFCDVSYGLPGVARFRVNVFIQRGSCAVVMRVIATAIPALASLGLPRQLAQVAHLRDGIVLVTGPRGSGKSSTLAALLDSVNQEQVCHIITIEDPIEFLHTHQRATVHQRELHSDTPSIALALRAALRQAPNVILVGEMRDRETMELVLEAAESGHMVLTSLNTVSVAKTVERVVGAFAASEQASIRSRLARTFRYIVSQRLIPRKDGSGRIAIVEMLKAHPRTLPCIEVSDSSGENLLQAMRDGASEGMQYFDGELEKLVHAGVIDLDTAMTYATDPQQLQQMLM